MEISITNHALERLKERLNVKAVSKAIRLTGKAWRRGIDLNEARWVGDEKLEGEYFPGKKMTKIYANTFFIFTLTGTLITVIPMKGRQLRAYQSHYRKIWETPHQRRIKSVQSQSYYNQDWSETLAFA